MKRTLALTLTIGSCVVLGDTGLRTGNSGSFLPVRDLECQKDGGILCVRDAGTKAGTLRCTQASATEPGCVVPGTQTFPAGKKTFSERIRVTGVAHGSLTACSSGEKGTWQTCTSHNAPVFCDGTDNHELLGSSADEVVLASIFVGGIPQPGYIATWTTPSTAAWTLNAVTGGWRVGTGTGTMQLLVTDLSNACACDIDCDVPGGRTSCTGSCTWAASSTLVLFRNTDTCTTDPILVGGNLHLMGVAQ